MADQIVIEDPDGPGQTDDRPPSDSEPTGETGPAVSEGNVRLPKDVIFGILSNERRRWVLKFLVENGGATNLSDLAEYIASNENDKPVAELDSGERKRVYICLYQAHLPKMNDADVIDYDQARGTVELREEADELLSYLTAAPTETKWTDSRFLGLIPAPLLSIGAKLVE